jgi:hypothetical protein
VPPSTPRRPLARLLAARPTDPGRPEPEPLELNLRTVILAGMAVWAATLLVAVVVTALGATTGRLVPVCLAGLALGCLGLLWVRRRRRGDDGR